MNITKNRPSSKRVLQAEQAIEAEQVTQAEALRLVSQRKKTAA